MPMVFWLMSGYFHPQMFLNLYGLDSSRAFRWVLSVMFLLKKSRIFCLENHFVRQKKGPTSLTPIL